MNVFTKDDRVIISDRWKPVINVINDHWAVPGMRGTVISEKYGVVRVKWDSLDATYGINEHWLDPVEDEVKTKTAHRIVGPKGFTETLGEDQIRGLVRAGILFHTETHVHDNEIVKIYKNNEGIVKYKVKDFRSDSKTLEEQFPKDN